MVPLCVYDVLSSQLVDEIWCRCVFIMSTQSVDDVRNNMHFILYWFCCEGRYCVNMDSKCLKIQGKVREFDPDWRMVTVYTVLC